MLSVEHGFLAEEMNDISGFLASDSVDVVSLHVQSMALVNVEDAWLEFRSMRSRFRPFLCLTGVVDRVKGDFPCGVGEVSLRDAENRGASSRVRVNYEFCDDELISLVKAGLYSDEDFALPMRVRRNVYELPWLVKASVIPEREGDSPVVFVELVDQFDCVMTRDKCRYDLGKIILDYAHEREQSRKSALILEEQSKTPLLNPATPTRGKHVYKDDRQENLLGIDSVEMGGVLAEAASALSTREVDSGDSVDEGRVIDAVGVQGESVVDARIDKADDVTKVAGKRRIRVSQKQLIARRNAREAALAGRRAAARLAMENQDGSINLEAVEKNVNQEFSL